MKKRIIELMTLFGYEYIKEQPSKRLLFYDPESQETIQIWKKKTIKEMELFTAQLIRNRVLNTGKSIGRFEVQNAIVKALGLEKGLPL